MKTLPSPHQTTHFSVLSAARRATICVVAAVSTFIGSHHASAQVTNAFDQASSYTFNTAFDTLNNGFGFGPWAVTVIGTGGHFIQNNGPSGQSFDLWNTSTDSSTIAVRPLSSAMAAGQSFFVKSRLNSLDGSTRTNGFILKDASGAPLFFYWHVGGDNLNGHYSDATVPNGTATNFPYAYQQFQSFGFHLTSPTNYTFVDYSSGGMVTGTISNAVAQVAFFRGSAAGTGGGQDFQFDQLMVVTGAAPVFSAQSPAPDSYGAVKTNISVSLMSGVLPINTNSIGMKVDGVPVTPTVSTISGATNITTLGYVPGSPLSGGALHTVQVTVADTGGNLFTNTWSFTTGFPTLPATLTGTLSTSNGIDKVICTAAGDDWLGTNYNATSSRTLYARFSMQFLNTADEPGNGGGGCYGGLHFFNGNTERLMAGETWLRTTWSVDTKLGGGLAGEPDLNPTNTVVVSNEWHTIVVRVDYSPSGNATERIWLDPNFALTELGQPVAPLVVTMNNTFDNIRLRCGNSPSAAEFSNIVFAATASGVGFAVPADPQFQGMVPANGALSVVTNTVVSAQVVIGGNPISAITMKVDGNTVTPTTATNLGIITLSYQPPVALSAGSLHTAQLVVTDSSSASFTNVWSFHTGYASLPIAVAGPLTTGGGNDLMLFSTAGEGWIGTNYNTSSSRTLYTRYSMVFNDLNNETGSGGGYGGLHFIEDNAEKLIAGNAWVSLNWSLDAAANQMDLSPALPVTLGEWHTIVVRTDYSPSGNDVVKVWLDPDFGQQEALQPNPPVTLNVDNSFNNVRLRCGNGTASATWSNIVVATTSAGAGFVAPSDPQFINLVPADGAPSVSVNSPVGATVLFGTYGIGTNNVALSVDGNAVAPSFVTTTNSMTINYQPPAPFAAGSFHTVALSVTDSNAASFSVNWSFTVDSYPSLPAVLAGSTNGTVDVSGGGAGTTIWSSQNGWIGNNYDTNSSATLYTRFTMNFLDLNNENGGGGGFGGLHFFRGNAEILLVGNNWGSTNWSIDDITAPDDDLLPVTPIVLGEWRTMVVKTEFVSNANDNITIWLDPDFNVAEGSQPNAPLTLSADNSFDSIHLRAGNGSAYAQFTNIIMAATAPGVGFPAVVPPAVLSIQKSGSNVDVSWTSTGTLQIAPVVTGPWIDVTNVSPQSIPATNAAQLFRVKQ